jgi:hypothetical protein
VSPTRPLTKSTKPWPGSGILIYKLLAMPAGAEPRNGEVLKEGKIDRIHGDATIHAVEQGVRDFNRSLRAALFGGKFEDAKRRPVGEGPPHQGERDVVDRDAGGGATLRGSVVGVSVVSRQPPVSRQPLFPGNQAQAVPPWRGFPATTLRQRPHGAVGTSQTCR